MDKKILEKARKELVTPSTDSAKKRSSAEKLPSAWVFAIFKKIQHRWLNKWSSQIEGIEEAVADEWGEVLHGLSGDDIKRGLAAMGGEWPPSAYEFKEFCKKPVTPFDGVTKRLPKPPITEEEKQQGLDCLQQMMGDIRR